ncbi:MAG: hypothetical protein HOP19_10440 [Acidobacteria bacterium]|nr:hypothetical protein [Acidobacteriota bacterium]
MQYTVMLTKDAEAHWRAAVPALPEYVVEAATREAALAQLSERLAQTQPQIEFVQVVVPDATKDVATNGQASTTKTTDPWPYFGAYAGDANWGEFFEELDRQRQ